MENGSRAIGSIGNKRGANQISEGGNTYAVAAAAEALGEAFSDSISNTGSLPAQPPQPPQWPGAADEAVMQQLPLAQPPLAQPPQVHSIPSQKVQKKTVVVASCEYKPYEDAVNRNFHPGDWDFIVEKCEGLINFSKHTIQAGDGLGLLEVGKLPGGLKDASIQYIKNLIAGMGSRQAVDSSSQSSADADQVSGFTVNANNVFCLNFVPSLGGDMATQGKRIEILFDSSVQEKLKAELEILDQALDVKALEIYNEVDMKLQGLDRKVLQTQLNSKEEIDKELINDVAKILSENQNIVIDAKVKANVEFFLQGMLNGQLEPKQHENSFEQVSRGVLEYNGTYPETGRRALNFSFKFKDAIGMNSVINRYFDDYNAKIEENVLSTPKSDTVPMLYQMSGNHSDLVEPFNPLEPTPAEDRVKNPVVWRVSQSCLLDIEMVQAAYKAHDNKNPEELKELILAKYGAGIDVDKVANVLVAIIEQAKDYDSLNSLMFTDPGDADPDDEAALVMKFNVYKTLLNNGVVEVNPPKVIVAGKTSEDCTDRINRLKDFMDTKFPDIALTLKANVIPGMDPNGDKVNIINIYADDKKPSNVLVLASAEGFAHMLNNGQLTTDIPTYAQG